jgi:hypothetical protein
VPAVRIATLTQGLFELVAPVLSIITHLASVGCPTGAQSPCRKRTLNTGDSPDETSAHPRLTGSGVG